MRQSAGNRQSPASCPSLAAQQREQAGLASAIGPDETGFLAGVQGQFSSFQEALRPAL